MSVILALCLGWLFGTALQLQQTQLWAQGAYSVGVALALCLALWGGLQNRLFPLAWRRGGRVCTCVAVAAILAFAQTGWRAVRYQQSQLTPGLEGRNVQLVGVVAAMPQRVGESWRFRFEVESLHVPAQAGNAPTHNNWPSQLLLGWYGPSSGVGNPAAGLAPPADLRAGDRWQFTVRLKAPHGHVNPHGFDYELWLWEQGLQATGYVRNGAHDPVPQWLGHTALHPVERLRQAARAAIETQVTERASAGIVAALLVGDQAAIERSDWDVFRATGVAHLMAISGLHITGLAWLAAAVMGWLWRHSAAWSPRRPWSLWCPAPMAAQWLGACVALAYAVFTGWGIPAQRTVWMVWVALALRAQGHRWPWPHTWALVCAVVVALDPWALLQAGFWLSFVAVGLLFAAGPAKPLASDSQSDTFDMPQAEASGHRRWHTLWRVVSLSARHIANQLRHMGREQWLMSVCLAPLSLLLFHQVSVVGLFANLLAVPWVTLLVTPLCVLGLLWPVCWDGAALCVQLLVAMLNIPAAQPWAQWSVPAAPLWAGVLGVLGMAVWALPWPAWMRCASVCWVLPVVLWQAPRPAPGTFELLAADMGQGHAVLLRTAHHALLYDTGPRYSAETDAGQRVLVPLLRVLGERLDAVLISHQDSDHSGGAHAVLGMQPQAQVWTSMPPEHPLRVLHPMQRCERGQHWHWDGVQFNVLHPDASDYGLGLKPNALSCVLRVQSAQGVVALLVGDIEAAQERSLLRDRQALHADWLLVPHHGSATSSTAEFLQAVQPQVAVVQAGYRNRFGHPKPEVLARYAAQGVSLVQSSQCGASTWRSESPAMVHCQRETDARYWHHRLP